MRRLAVIWMMLAGLMVGMVTGCAPDSTQKETSGKSGPSDKTDSPKQPKPPTDDPG